MIDYDASRDALYSPGLRPALFAPGSRISDIGVDAVCAELSRLAYLAFEIDDIQRRQLILALESVGLSGWTGFTAPATGTEAFVTTHHDTGDVFLVFRGTAPGDIKDLVTDLNVRPIAWAVGGNVHAGFSTAFASVREEIEAWLDQHAAHSTLTLTGHSLGAALATLAMSQWQARRLITFGCPRVGDARFAATIAAGLPCVMWAAATSFAAFLRWALGMPMRDPCAISIAMEKYTRRLTRRPLPPTDQARAGNTLRSTRRVRATCSCVNSPTTRRSTTCAP